MKKILVLCLFLLACSKHTRTQAEIVTEELQSLVDIITPSLQWCDGAVTKNNCDTGDSMLFTGLALTTLDWPMVNNMMQSIKDSIDPITGQPYRSPKHRNNQDSIDAFSRDQLLGFINYLISTKDVTSARKVFNYIKSNNNKLCPKDTDNRCNLSLSTMALLDDVSQFLGMGQMYNVNRWLDEQATIVEAKTTPVGYQKNLIAVKILLKSRMGRLTKNYAKSVEIITQQQPNNLFFQYVYNITYRNVLTSIATNIGSALSSCMKQWNHAGNTWAFEVRRDSFCESDAMGHEYTLLAKLLIEKFPAIEMTENFAP